MAGSQHAWVTRAPADYVLLFVEEPDSEHAVVSARFENEDAARDALCGLEGGELSGAEASVFCTLPDEAERVLSKFRTAAAETSWVDRGTIRFVAVGDGSGTRRRPTDGDDEVTARVVLPIVGEWPRCYRLEEQCPTCGEFRGKINVLPQGGVMIDTRTLNCRCESIPCRYCEHGTVRRPLTEHFDPERRAGHTPWFGYLVPCGHCQAAGRGPKVLMSA